MKNVTTPAFSIKVALVGYVSVGKTTLLNALFREKYGEVAMRRATASVNHYCVSKRDVDTTADVLGANEVLNKTIQENARLRTSDVVEEKSYDIELEHDIVPEMRDDARLEFVDIPGINEAGTSSKYKDYVTNQWHAFDCVVIVMDGRQGVNTDEQVELLKLAKSNCDKIKSVPIIVVCNKIDDPDDEEQMLLVDEARKAVQEIFETEDQAKALASIIEPSSSATRRISCPKVVTLPFSAVHAFIYQAANGVEFEQFKRFDNDYIEKLGKDNFGMGWRRLTNKRKFEKAFEVVNDKSLCQDGLELSNFNKFAAALSFFVGGKDTQTSLLKHQIGTALSRLNAKQGKVLVDDIRCINNGRKALNLPTDEISTKFWDVFGDIVIQCFDSFKTPSDVHVLANAMNQLFYYLQFVIEAGWSDEIECVLLRAKTIVGKQASIIMNQFDREKVSRSADLVLMYGSFLLQCGESFFYENFGHLKILMEDRVRIASVKPVIYSCPMDECNGSIRKCPGDQTEMAVWDCNVCKKSFTCRGTTTCPVAYKSYGGNLYYKQQYENKVDQNGDCSYCGYNHFYDESLPKHDIIDGVPNPVFESPKLLLVPESLEDPNHFGHVVWQFGRIFKAAKAASDS